MILTADDSFKSFPTALSIAKKISLPLHFGVKLGSLFTVLKKPVSTKEKKNTKKTLSLQCSNTPDFLSDSIFPNPLGDRIPPRPIPGGFPNRPPIENPPLTYIARKIISHKDRQNAPLSPFASVINRNNHLWVIYRFIIHYPVCRAYVLGALRTARIAFSFHP